MSTSERPLWRGRTLALLGIVLFSFNLRTVVAAISPIVDQIGADIPLSATTLGLIGTLPPLCFAVFGFLTPWFTRAVGMINTLLWALAVMLLGHLVRSFADSAPILIIGTALSLAGMGIGNVLMPPLVKRYFPDRIALMTAFYSVGMAASTMVPALLVPTVADTLGWRWSLGMWTSVAVIAVIPWIIMLSAGPAADTRPMSIPVLTRRLSMRRLWTSRMAVPLAIVAGVNSLNAYAVFAWLPQIFQDLAGMDVAFSGPLLSLNAMTGIPVSLLLPLLARRMRNVAYLFYVGALCLVLCYLGLLFFPMAAPLAWAVLNGFGLQILPVVFILISMRTRTEEGAVALSGFVNGVGYTFAASGPLMVGVFHEFTGGWTLPLLFLLGSGLVAVVATALVVKPRMLEDTLWRRRRDEDRGQEQGEPAQ